MLLPNEINHIIYQYYPTKCNNCKLRFNIKENLLKNNNKQCNICNKCHICKIRKSKNNLVYIHLSIFTIYKYVCENCLLNYYTKYEYK